MVQMTVPQLQDPSSHLHVVLRCGADMVDNGRRWGRQLEGQLCRAAHTAQRDGYWGCMMFEHP